MNNYLPTRLADLAKLSLQEQHWAVRPLSILQDHVMHAGHYTIIRKGAAVKW